MVCSYCRIELTQETKSVDHVLPRSFGGTKPGNAVWSCIPCNVAKGNKLVSPINPQWVRGYKTKAFNKARRRVEKALKPTST